MTATPSVAPETRNNDSMCPILIVEAAAEPRRRWLKDRLEQMPGPGARTWSLCCDFDVGGPWAGVNELFASLVEEIRAQRPDLIERHALELLHVLPQLTHSLTVLSPSLTDIAAPDEKVRSYAADRVFRVVHGLIELLDSWKSAACPDSDWIIACDGFDAAGAIGGRFFRELMRRRGERLRLRLLAGVAPGKGEQVRAALNAARPAEVISFNLNVSGEPPFKPDASAAAKLASELEERTAENRAEMQANLPDLIRIWSLAGRPDKVLRWRYFGLSVYIHLGLYEDGLRYGDGLLPLAAEHAPDDERLRWRIILKTLNCYSGMQDAKSALRFAEKEASDMIDHGDWESRTQLLYLMAMLYARFQQPRDLPKGEAYLDRALAILEQANLSESDFHFQRVFNRNGVAMIRNFQGRHQEAIELCRAGLDELNLHLSAEKHRLHRSVLIYNMAQVYSATGHPAEALEYYSAVIAMDPNYSEYYNERGGVLLRLGRLEEARADYLQAIQLSPPYFEVFTNLGQCYRRMGAMQQAVESYSRALDLEPNQLLAMLGRAKAYEELGQREAAMADYTAVLARDSKQWDAAASRGVLYYEAGDLNAALADLDRAVEIAPDQVCLYQNRAVVLADLGRQSEVARDLEAALKLNLTDEHRAELQARLEIALRSVS